ncbi:MAG: AMP-binding protein [Candidatus Helarchaeota archaeon]
MSVYESKFWTKSYDKHVKKSLDYPTESLGKIFDKSMSEFPDKIACTFMNGKLTYKELQEYVHKFATFLQKNGLKKGDRVAINLPNTPQYLIAHFGTILAGGAASGCSPLLSAEEITYQLNDSEAKFIITIDAVYAKVIKNVLHKIPKLIGVITVDISTYMGFSKIKVILGKYLARKIPHGKSTPFPGKIIIKLQDLLNTTPMDVKDVDINVKDDLALLQYTGGTTGRPKGTELTHSNIIANLCQTENWLDLQKGSEIALSAFPYFHLAGLIFCMATVYLANTQILIANPRDTDHIIAEIKDKKPTMIANVPTLYLMIKNNPKSLTIPKSTLDICKIYLSGAAPFPAEAIRDYEKHMQATGKVCEVYGMTETSPLLTMNPKVGTKKVGTVGLPLQDTEVKFIDIDTGEVVDIGKPGEILCRGPQVTRGYYNKPEANKKTIIDGWLHTGDVGIMDEDGYVRIVDRVKDMLIVSGFKVYSVHVEDILVKHPAIELVAIIGDPDPKRPGSEIVHAYVKLKEGIESTETIRNEIKKYAMDNLSKYEVPKIWDFKDDLPLTTVGKVLKRELRIKLKDVQKKI